MTSLILIGSPLQFRKEESNMHSITSGNIFSHTTLNVFLYTTVAHSTKYALLPQLIFHVTFNWVFSHGIFLPRYTVFSYTVLLNVIALREYIYNFCTGCDLLLDIERVEKRSGTHTEGNTVFVSSKTNSIWKILELDATNKFQICAV